MRLTTFIGPGQDEPVGGEIRDGQAIAFGDGSSVLDRLRSGDRRPAVGDAWPVDEVRLLAPVPRPRAIFAIGLNYRDHVAEADAALPERPLVFLKLDTSSAPPNGAVGYPEVIGQLDYEGELAVVMGPDRSVAGYAVADDLSARDLQVAEPQWTRAKAFDGSCPWGPWITTPEHVENPNDLRLRTFVNGEPRQDASTTDLVFDVPTVIDFIAQTCTLHAGDLILTGTPAGVGLVMDPPRLLGQGDVVRVEIDGLGAIEHRIAGTVPMGAAPLVRGGAW